MQNFNSEKCSQCGSVAVATIVQQRKNTSSQLYFAQRFCGRSLLVGLFMYAFMRYSF